MEGQRNSTLNSKDIAFHLTSRLWFMKQNGKTMPQMFKIPRNIFCLISLFLLCLVTNSCPTICDPMDYSNPGSSVLEYLLEFARIHVLSVGDAIQSSHPLLAPSLPAFSLSHIRVFSNEFGSLHQVAKVWSFSFSISPFQ